MNSFAKASLCLAVLVLPSLTGCGGSSSSSPGAPGLAPRSVSATLPNGLLGTMTEDRAAVSVGGTVSYTLTLSNPTTQPITYQPALSGTFFSSVPAYLAVAAPGGNLAFPSGVLPQFGGIGPSTTLASGQSVTGTISVGSSSLAGQGGYAVAGAYTATAAFVVYEGASGGQQIAASAGPLSVTAQ